MQKPKTRVITYTLLSVASALVLYYFFRTKSLKNDLQYSMAQYQEVTDSIAVYEPLITIDSMLFNGQYAKALKAYKAQLNKEDDRLNNVLKLRINLVHQLISRENEKNTAIDSAALAAANDSLKNNRYATPAEIRQYDSLNFALAKANLQLQNLKRQLKQKTKGAYLTFNTSKGKKLHYVGEVKNKEANGRGVALLISGSRYEGEWKNSLRHGKGTFHWPDGQYYVGNYKEDKRHGKGTYHWPNGEQYTGQWENDQRNGEGIFYGKDGKVVASGTWKNDKLVEVDK